MADSSQIQSGNRSPTVSVGLPVHNGGRFLAQALDSILGQSLQDIEVIISDNASTDDSAAICRAYSSRDPRIRYIHQVKNLGAARNWNFVAEQAQGKYFKWSSANDFCAKTMLEKCVAAMEADPSIVLCHGKTCLVEEETNAQMEYDRDIALTDASPIERFKTLCLKLALNNAQNGIIRHDALKRTRLEGLYPHGDLALMAELALQGKFVLLPEILFYRRMGPESFSSLLTSDQLQEFIDPHSKLRPGFNRLRLHLDYFSMMGSARIGLREKLRGLTFVVHNAFWDKALIWAELRNGMRRRAD